MSQAINPFSLRAGIASSLLRIAQICTPALYILVMSQLDVSAVNMLVFILAFGGVISFILILLIHSPVHGYANEKIVSTS
ncbi:hypothetical protein [Psychromonas aquimarina]|uniref:hypothetical protein n=1 Tax=Psychromonas aquimarina TaxID=444919 RepID=UPI00048AB977|nr:hypothetical protein [Psychromonas aquimarina]